MASGCSTRSVRVFFTTKYRSMQDSVLYHDPQLGTVLALFTRNTGRQATNHGLVTDLFNWPTRCRNAKNIHHTHLFPNSTFSFSHSLYSFSIQFYFSLNSVMKYHRVHGRLRACPSNSNALRRSADVIGVWTSVQHFWVW